MESPLKVELGFVPRRLPWIVAGVALAFYLVTLNYSSTTAGVTSLAKAAGWDWRANVIAPLHVILTYPVRWLPAGLQLFGLNLTAAICAAAALGLLARSVALLPHDRTREQRAVERSDYSLLSIKTAWLPPLLAALVCGLQSSFWENAVVATGESLDLLIFAWLVHALLLYRLDENESRLSRFALVYGLGVTNNLAMIGFFPAFLVALIWIKGRTFFKWRFLLRMLGWGLAGLALYVVLPLAEGMSPNASYSFWELFRGYWAYQKNTLLAFPRWIAGISALFSVLPVLFMGIRWPAQFGDTSAAGNILTNLMTHLIHAIFLGACLYVMFDPAASPKSLAIQNFQFSAMLPFYYLGALAIGYCSGYFLLIFGAKPGPQAWQRPSPIRKAANAAIVAAVWVALLVVPAALFSKNVSEIWSNAGKYMDRLSRLAAQSLPEQGAFVLSDDVFRLFALRRELQISQPNHRHVLIDTTSLGASDYHRYLQRMHPDRWLKFETPPRPKGIMDTVSLLQLLYKLHEKGPVVYLQPSFGYYFEFFQARPRGAVYELKPYPTNSVSAPLLTAEEIKQEDDFWRALKASVLEPLARTAPPFAKPAKGKFTPPPPQSLVCNAFSAALDCFGVELQKAGDLARAAEYFDLAAKLSPDSPIAYANREFNGHLRAGTPPPQKPSEALQDRIGAMGGRWDAALSRFGPADEPSICYVLARLFEQGGNFRQAAQLLERTIHFEPQNKSARLAYMLMCVQSMLPDIAMRSIADFKARFPDSTLTEEETGELLRAEAWAYVVRNDLPTAERLLTSSSVKSPKRNAPWETLLDIYVKLGRITNAVALLEKQLDAQPGNVRALVSYAAIKIQSGKIADAIPLLDRALQQDPKDEQALLNRAIANFKLDRIDAAIADYDILRSTARPAYQLQVVYGLAEAYFRKKDVKESLRLYRQFEKDAPPGIPEIIAARERIKLLESGSSL
jgi:tetratricopeptide (TPR) repeat protein